MIFVTVGTHEQQFDRLVRRIDELKGKGMIREDVMIQTGYSQWKPRNCEWSQWLPYQEMVRYVDEARIVITHGGPSSFLMPLKMGKVPVVVPRKKEFGEHVNNHQVDFVRELNANGTCLVTVEDIENLGEVLAHYDQYSAVCQEGPGENNARFNRQMIHMVEQLMRPKRRYQIFGVRENVS